MNRRDLFRVAVAAPVAALPIAALAHKEQKWPWVVRRTPGIRVYGVEIDGKLYLAEWTYRPVYERA